MGMFLTMMLVGILGIPAMVWDTLAYFHIVEPHPLVQPIIYFTIVVTVVGFMWMLWVINQPRPQDNGTQKV
ncbi:hypothetical protein HY624_02155 [Candidatus Uhrbacteria bacterium]|nr:hypothetical protein [Candidatus Uhrbacteria bacterium]